MLFFLFAFFTEVAGTMAGFGSSTLVLPLALLFFDFKSALVIVALLHIFGNVGRVAFFRHGLDKRLIILFGIPSVICAVIGASLVNYISQDVLRFILGIFLLLFAGVSLIKPALQFPPTKTSALVGGGASGFIAGLIGTGGALRGSFLTAFNLDKNVYIATSAIIAIAVDITRLPIYLAGGFLDAQYYWYIPILFAVAIVGSFIGKLIMNIISQHTFRVVVLSAIGIIGMKFILDWISI
ncbi:sulfonate transporter [Candidatus Azambacteria bacterium RBG_16_47_10]|uniref:Probable membrane transporter protein n=1 Tax=Candidatus Azambacteria bacterium RBG_16_47_10 TaxID=1797292 RepID=A0A1F5B0E4_9BACT|nr:MAG: sulfonate transporter [Candidatus Azambacteria bacterium RBG_16_47_10]